MRGENGNAMCYAVELCEVWEILNKITAICPECQIISSLWSSSFLFGWNGIEKFCICVLVTRAKHYALFPKSIKESCCAYIELIVHNCRSSHNYIIKVGLCKFIQFAPCFNNSYYSISGGNIDPAVGGYGRGKIHTGFSQNFPIQ